jgi:hypothetical protein
MSNVRPAWNWSVSSSRTSPKRTSPKRTSPKRTSLKRTSPKRTSLKRAKKSVHFASPTSNKSNITVNWIPGKTERASRESFVPNLSSSQKKCVFDVLNKYNIYDYDDLKASDLPQPTKKVIHSCLKVMDKKKLTKMEKQQLKDFFAQMKV